MGNTQIYSEKAIEICPTLRAVFRLPLRQTQGFVESLLEMAGFDLKATNYSTLCRRSKDFDVVLLAFSGNEPIEIAVDGTGLKVFGEGEWKVRTHNVSKRRVWRKLHIAINTATLEIVAAVATEADTADSEVVEDLLMQIDEPVSRFLGEFCPSEGMVLTTEIHVTNPAKNEILKSLFLPVKMPYYIREMLTNVI